MKSNFDKKFSRWFNFLEIKHKILERLSPEVRKRMRLCTGRTPYLFRVFQQVTFAHLQLWYNYLPYFWRNRLRDLSIAARILAHFLVRVKESSFRTSYAIYLSWFAPYFQAILSFKLFQPRILIVPLSSTYLTSPKPWSRFYKDFRLLEPLLMLKIIAIDAFDFFSIL